MSINKRNKQEHTEISLKKYTNILKTSNKKKTKIVVFFSRKFSRNVGTPNFPRFKKNLESCGISNSNWLLKCVSCGIGGQIHTDSRFPIQNLHKYLSSFA